MVVVLFFLWEGDGRDGGIRFPPSRQIVEITGVTKNKMRISYLVSFWRLTWRHKDYLETP